MGRNRLFVPQETLDVWVADQRADVSATELVTNCHVLEGARKVILKQNKREWIARIVRSQVEGTAALGGSFA